MKLLKTVWIILTGIVLSIQTVAQTDNQRSDGQEPVSISGTVIDEATRQGVPGVSIIQDKKVLGLTKDDGSFFYFCK